MFREILSSSAQLSKIEKYKEQIEPVPVSQMRISTITLFEQNYFDIKRISPRTGLSIDSSD